MFPLACLLLTELAGPYESITVEDKIQRAWAELTTIIRQSNTEMFESKRRTRQAVDSGEHFQFMDKFKPKLQEWKDRLEQTDSKSACVNGLPWALLTDWSTPESSADAHDGIRICP